MKELPEDHVTGDPLLRNAILALLSERECAAVRDCGQLVDFHLRKSVYQPEQPIESAYFPSTASSRSSTEWRTEA